MRTRKTSVSSGSKRKTVARDRLFRVGWRGGRDSSHLAVLGDFARIAPENHESAKPNEGAKNRDVARRRSEKRKNAHGYWAITSFASRSTRGTITLNAFLGLMFARPPRGVPVIAKKAAVVALGGTTPDASAIEA